MRGEEAVERGHQDRACNCDCAHGYENHEEYVWYSPLPFFGNGFVTLSWDTWRDRPEDESSALRHEVVACGRPTLLTGPQVLGLESSGIAVLVESLLFHHLGLGRDLFNVLWFGRQGFVVTTPLFRVRETAIGLHDFQETNARLRIVCVSIGVSFLRALAKASTQFKGGGVSRNAQHFIVVRHFGQTSDGSEFELVVLTTLQVIPISCKSQLS
jgi:hypothetical protein